MELARHFNSLVCKTACAEIAQRLELGLHITMAASEARSGGRKKEVILADACEALLGAILVDGGSLASEAAVRALVGAADRGRQRLRLQTQKLRCRNMPKARSGGFPNTGRLAGAARTTRQVLRSEVSVRGLKPECGAGPSLKKAQQAAAEALLKREAVWPVEGSMPEKETTWSGPHCGFVAVIGAPNAGKSTLVNALVGAKVSIVTHKAQTTRARLRGIAIAGKSQIILVDTPGIFTPKRRLDRAMVATAWTEAREADVAVLVVDAARGLDDVVEPIFQQAQRVLDLARPRSQ